MCSARSARSGSSSSASRWRSSSLVGLGLALQDQRLVEVAVAQLARLVGDHRVAALGGQLEPVEHAAELVADGADELVGALQAPLEDRHHRGAGRGRRAPGRRTAGSTPPRARACGRGCRRRSGRARAAAASRSARAAARPWRRASAGTRAGTPAGCAAARAPESWRARLSARTSLKTSSRRCSPAISSAPRRRAGSRARGGPRRRRRRSRAASSCRRSSAAAHGASSSARVGGEAHALGGLLGGLVLDRLELQQRRVRGDLHVGAGQHAAHAAGERRGQRGLHLHRLDDRDDVALGHLVALADRDRDDHGRAVRCARSRRRRG